MGLHDQTEQQWHENELRGTIDALRAGHRIAFAHFVARPYLDRIEPERIARAKTSCGVTETEFAGWQAAYSMLPQEERGRAEYVLNTFAGKPGEFLTFRLGAEEYGIAILRIQEIRSYEAPTRIANVPECIKGVVNLRGVIVPIVDLRLKFSLPAEYNAFTVVVVLNVRDRLVGAVVDSVSDVLELSKAQIKPALSLTSSVESPFITGIGTVRNGQGDDTRERLIILLDIEALMGSADMGLIPT